MSIFSKISTIAIAVAIFANPVSVSAQQFPVKNYEVPTKPNPKKNLKEQAIDVVKKNLTLYDVEVQTLIYEILDSKKCKKEKKEVIYQYEENFFDCQGKFREVWLYRPTKNNTRLSISSLFQRYEKPSKIPLNYSTFCDIYFGSQRTAANAAGKPEYEKCLILFQKFMILKLIGEDFSNFPELNQFYIDKIQKVAS